MDTMIDNEIVVICFVVVQHFFVNLRSLPHSDICSCLLLPLSPDHHDPWPVCQGYHPCLAFFPSVASPDLQATILTFGAVIVTPLPVSPLAFCSLEELTSASMSPIQGETEEDDESRTYVVAVGPSILNCGFLTTNVHTSSHDLYIDKWP